MNARIVFSVDEGALNYEQEIISFSFRKDVYSSHTELTVSFIADNDEFESVTGLKFYIGNELIHHGLVDNLEHKNENGRRVAVISSRGFTSLLTQNHLEPGPMFSVSVNSLIDDVYSFSNVTHESSSTTNYIYINRGSSVWDGVVNLSYKNTGAYPFIAGANHVRISPLPSPEKYSYTNSQLIAVGEKISTKKIISHFHMADLEGEYGTYEYTDSFALSKNIVRHQFFEFDRRFLYSPNDALLFRSKFSKRANYCRYCRYIGYNGEDLTDLVSFGDLTRKKICSIIIKGENNCITTELGVYSDGFYT